MKKFDKARKEQTPREKKWYMFKYKDLCCPFWIAPLIPVAIASKEFEDWTYHHRKWSEKRATRVLNKILPHYLEWDEEEQAYFYCMDNYYRWMHKKAWFFDRAWARKFDYELHAFIRDGYENKHYTKSEVKEDYDIYVKFVEK